VQVEQLVALNRELPQYARMSADSRMTKGSELVLPADCGLRIATVGEAGRRVRANKGLQATPNLPVPRPFAIRLCLSSHIASRAPADTKILDLLL